MKRAFFLPLVLLVAGTPAVAQEAAAPETANAEAAVIERALEDAAAGDVAAAIARVEALGEASTVATKALLGALYLENGRPAEALATLEPLAVGEDADAAVLYNAGRAANALGRRDEARSFLERSLPRANATPAARVLALIYLQERRYTDAYALLRPWSAANPGDTEARMLAALCAVQLRRPNEAEGLLSDLPQDDPRIKLLWGRLLLLKADPWGALAILRPLLEEAPPAMESDVRRLAAESYAAVGEAAKAVEVLAGHVGDNASVALQLGQAQYQSGDLDAALVTLQPFAEGLLAAVAETDLEPPATATALIVEYGRLLATSGRHSEALPFLETATRLDPDDKQSWQQLGQALAAVGRRDEAKEALARFQEIVTNEVPASLGSVQLEKDLEDPTGRELRTAMKEMERGDEEAALAIVRREMALVPEDIRPHLVEANILLLSGNTEAALAAADRLVAGAPWSADAHYIRGAASVGLGDMESGETDLRKALELSPDHTAAMNDLAVVLLTLGSNDEARTLLERALELRPNDPLARANLERLGG